MMSLYDVDAGKTYAAGILRFKESICIVFLLRDDKCYVDMLQSMLIDVFFRTELPDNLSVFRMFSIETGE